MVVVGYDPFAREGLVRVSVPGGTCAWCGREKRTLFQYIPESEYEKFGTRFAEGAFCNLQCYLNYHC